MSWKHWTAILVVIGGGILLQIQRQADERMTDTVAAAGPDESQRAQPTVQAVAGPYRTLDLDVTGMTCSSCETTARLAVEQIEGVTEADFSYPHSKGTVTYDTTLTSPAVIIAELERATGYVATRPGR